jgi:hypothetical protein
MKKIQSMLVWLRKMVLAVVGERRSKAVHLQKKLIAAQFF